MDKLARHADYKRLSRRGSVDDVGPRNAVRATDRRELASAIEELQRRADLGHRARVHDEDAIEGEDGAQAVCDGEDRLVRELGPQRFLSGSALSYGY